MPRVIPEGIGAPLQFASSGGGGGNYDDPDDDYFDEEPEEPAPRRRRNRDEGQPTAARERTVQSDPDDRYWTDYLRIALPVIGLLLVIAVFWFWAQQLIDDDSEDLTPTEAGLAEVVESPTAPAEVQPLGTPTPEDAGQSAPPPATAPQDQQQSMPSPTPPPEEPETEPDAGTDNQVEEAPADDAAEETTDEGADAGGIAPDAQVSVTDGPLNMRASASTEADIVAELETGAILTVLSGPEEAEEYTWWQVVDETGGNQGWVAEDFIEPAE